MHLAMLALASRATVAAGRVVTTWVVGIMALGYTLHV